MSAAELAKSTSESIVGIGTKRRRGAGFVIENGFIITSAHNLRGREVGVSFADGRRDVGVAAGVDADDDLAAIRVETGDASPLPLGGTADLGDRVYVVGPTGDGGVRVTAGDVSSVDRSFRGPRGALVSGAIEHTAPVARGTSGGPVLDAGGAIVGINTHRLGDGFYLAHAIDDDLGRRLRTLIAGKSVKRRRLGVAAAPSHAARKMRRQVGLDERSGVLVRAVESDSPAERAGLERGDLIVAAGGDPVADIDDIHDALEALEGDSIGLKVVRGVDESDVSVSFGRPDSAADEDAI